MGRASGDADDTDTEVTSAADDTEHAEHAADRGAPGAAELPEPVRRQVVARASSALDRIPAAELPAGVRRFAGFAARQRARLADAPLTVALDDEPGFRARVAADVREHDVDAVAAASDAAAAASTAASTVASDATGAPPPAQLAVVAGDAWLLRSDGWVDLVAAATDSARRSRRDREVRREEAVSARLAEQVDQVRADLRRNRQRSRARTDELKAENAGLRHKVNEARQRAERAERTAAEAQAELANLRADLGRELDRERRRLQTELDRAADAARRARQDSGARRELDDVRLRLLLDTLVQGAAGLRAELGLPADTGTRPADLVDAGVDPSLAAAPSGVTPIDDPVLLDDLLTLPQVHLVLDGYNVTKTAWPDLPLRDQRRRLLTALGALVSQLRTEVTVVFDGADLTTPVPVAAPRGVRVRFSPPGVIADDVIRDLVVAEPTGRIVLVVTSDALLARRVAAAGARPVASATMVGRLTRH